jgi:uroporphyrinogen III methyltransferase/synthase
MNDAPASSPHGTVYIVGAGPGDPDLLTLKGAQALQRADVVFYDELLDRRLLDLTPAHCERIHVGKRGGRPSHGQEAINAQMVERAQSGQRVVRLKGGDPLVFGRGGEEVLHLKAAHLDVEIIPGISAAAGATAYAGIPLTHRGIASTAVLVTGNEDPNGSRSPIDWATLARLDATLVVFMAARTLPSICRTLVEHGRPSTTPAAVIEWGTWARQRTVEGTLADLAERAADAAIASPMLLAIGDVVALRSQLMWREFKPLFGRSILLTRSKDQADELTERLSAAGADVHTLPLIELLPTDDVGPLDAAIADLATWHWLLFTSTNGVRFFFQRLFSLGLDARALSHLHIAAVGGKTAHALTQHGLRADLVPDEASQDGLARALRERDIQGQRFLFPTSDIGRTELVSALAQRGAHVERVIAYQNRAPAIDPTGWNPNSARFDMVVFASPSSAHNAFDVLGPTAAHELMSRCAIACIGSTTAEAVRTLGFSVQVQPAHSSIPALADAICAFYQVAD